MSYFSGISKEDRERTKSVFEGINELVEIGNSFKYDDLKSYDDVLKKFEEIGLDISMINDHFQNENLNDSIRELLLIFSGYAKSDFIEHKPNIISYEKNSLVINNTIIFILEKRIETDINTDEILNRIRDVFISTGKQFCSITWFRDANSIQQ